MRKSMHLHTYVCSNSTQPAISLLISECHMIICILRHSGIVVVY